MEKRGSDLPDFKLRVWAKNAGKSNKTSQLPSDVNLSPLKILTKLVMYSGLLYDLYTSQINANGRKGGDNGGENVA